MTTATQERKPAAESGKSNGNGNGKAQGANLQKQDTALQLNHSERFTNKVFAEFGSNVSGELKVTDYQRQLIQGYFLVIDRALKDYEEKRISKNKRNSDHKYDNNLSYTWDNINMPALARDAMHYAYIGLDMMQANHLSPVPYKNNTTKLYDLTLTVGYNGVKYTAEKYALEVPRAVTIELVYSTDIFKPIKKNATNRVEDYSFDIPSPFDRGEIVGGFGYIEYAEPLKNKLIIMTLKDILKRKPKKAAPEFWGGPKDIYENGKKVGTEHVEGWFDEMCKKTLIREVYNSRNILLDPKKIDDSYHYMKMQEAKIAEMEAQAERDEYANAIDLEADDYKTADDQPETANKSDTVTNPTPPPNAPAAPAGDGYYEASESDIPIGDTPPIPAAAAGAGQMAMGGATF